MKVHSTVRVVGGKYAGLVGVVVAVKGDTGMIRVEIKGAFNGEDVDISPWMKPASLEVV